MSYAFAKFVHVLSSTVLFGTGVGSAYYLLRASLDGTPVVVARVARWVVLADWLFTATTVVLQPLTGWYLVRTAHFDWRQKWLFVSIGLFALAVVCWLPVVGLQMRMRDIADAAARAGTPLPRRFRTLLIAWCLLGVPAFVAFVAIFYLMTAKPA